MLSNVFLLNRAFYEIKCKNIADPGRPQMAIWRMRTACWIPKAANKHTVCNTYCFLLQQLLHERASVLRYVRQFNAMLFIC